MKVLVACEESQVVTIELRKLGHEAYSCDIEPCSGGHPEWHIKGNVLNVLNGNAIFRTSDSKIHYIDGRWDMIIAHPPCTYLTTCGNRAYSLKFNSREKVNARIKEREKAFNFFMKFMNANCPKIAIENPQGFVNTHYRKPDQTVHPYYFAESKEDKENYHQKKTCFWLKGLPPLIRTNDLPKPEPMYVCQGKNQKAKELVGVRGCET